MSPRRWLFPFGGPPVFSMVSHAGRDLLLLPKMVRRSGLGRGSCCATTEKRLGDALPRSCARESSRPPSVPGPVSVLTPVVGRGGDSGRETRRRDSTAGLYRRRFGPDARLQGDAGRVLAFMGPGSDSLGHLAFSEGLRHRCRRRSPTCCSSCALTEHRRGPRGRGLSRGRGRGRPRPRRVWDAVAEGTTLGRRRPGPDLTAPPPPTPRYLWPQGLWGPGRLGSRFSTRAPSPPTRRAIPL